MEFYDTEYYVPTGDIKVGDRIEYAGAGRLSAGAEVLEIEPSALKPDHWGVRIRYIAEITGETTEKWTTVKDTVHRITVRVVD